jgi:cell division protein FtsB
VSDSAASTVAGPFRAVLGGAALLLVLVLCIAGLDRYGDLKVQRAREALLLERIEETEERVVELRNRIQLLKEDPGTLERVAREDLGMARAGDIVVKFDNEATRQ